MVLIKSYDAPPYCDKEILRYAGCKEETAEVRALLDACKKEAADKLSYKVCYLVLPLAVDGERCELGGCTFLSKDLAKNLAPCTRAIVFAATLGVGIERLIAKYSAVSPAKALLFDAIGTERIEALCDAFCEDMKTELQTAAQPRFSPGYGDFGLSFQKDIFALLGCEKRIGLTITSSLLMSPSKSVSAVMGLCAKGGNAPQHKCARCTNTDCAFRRNV